MRFLGSWLAIPRPYYVPVRLLGRLPRTVLGSAWWPVSTLVRCKCSWQPGLAEAPHGPGTVRHRGESLFFGGDKFVNA